MDEIEIEHRLTETEQRSKSNTHRIDKLEPIVNEIHTISETLVQLVGEVRHTNDAVDKLEKKVDQIDSRVEGVEKKPGDKTEKHKEMAVSTAIGTTVGAVVMAAIQAIVHFI